MTSLSDLQIIATAEGLDLAGAVAFDQASEQAAAAERAARAAEQAQRPLDRITFASRGTGRICAASLLRDGGADYLVFECVETGQRTSRPARPAETEAAIARRLWTISGTFVSEFAI